MRVVFFTVCFLSSLFTSVIGVLEKEFYELLEVKPSATESEIKKAFRKLSRTKHPDNSKSKDAHSEFTRIREAYEILIDPDLRHMYDMYGKAGVMDVDDSDMDGGPGANTDSGGGIFDMFGNLFGGGSNNQQQRRGGNRRRGRQQSRGRGNAQAIKRNMPRTQDLMVSMTVGLEDFYKGGEKTFSFKRNVICSHCRGTGALGGETTKCPRCNGRGSITVTQEVMPGFHMQSEQTCPKCHGRGRIFKHECPVCHGHGVHPQMTKITLEVEPGMKPGDSIRFERKAEERPGHIPGDVVVTLKMAEHPYWRRNHDDLYTTTDISLKQALLGFDLSIEHMDQHMVSLKHWDITHHGKQRRYKGEGMPKRHSKGRFGNLYVDYHVNFPSEISEQDRNTLMAIWGDQLPLNTFTPVPQK